MLQDSVSLNNGLSVVAEPLLGVGSYWVSGSRPMDPTQEPEGPAPLNPATPLHVT
jgi:hypothetical protein